MNNRDKLIELIIEAKQKEPKAGIFVDALANYLVSHGVTVERWIPVGERLPESGEIVLTWSKTFYDLAADTVENFEWEGVTHWLPLPEPPKGDNDAD